MTQSDTSKTYALKLNRKTVHAIYHRVFFCCRNSSFVVKEATYLHCFHSLHHPNFQKICIPSQFHGFHKTFPSKTLKTVFCDVTLENFITFGIDNEVDFQERGLFSIIFDYHRNIRSDDVPCSDTFATNKEGKKYLLKGAFFGVRKSPEPLFQPLYFKSRAWSLLVAALL